MIVSINADNLFLQNHTRMNILVWGMTYVYLILRYCFIFIKSPIKEKNLKIIILIIITNFLQEMNEKKIDWLLKV
jgi:hypothetical protein